MTTSHLPDELLDMGILNNTSLLDHFEAFQSVEAFMRAELYMGLHSTNTTCPHLFLTHSYDVDGVVVEFEKAKGLLALFHHLPNPKVAQP